MNDELERLRAENDKLIYNIQAPDGYPWEWHCARKDEEIERLREELDSCSDCMKRADAEIERLEEVLDGDDKAISDQEAEIERLRGLLREALDTYGLPVEWYWHVREALSDVPLSD